MRGGRRGPGGANCAAEATRAVQLTSKRRQKRLTDLARERNAARRRATQEQISRGRS